jgi:PST family polysaccharide transporter
MTEHAALPQGSKRLTSSIAALMGSNVIGALLGFAISVLIGRASGEIGLGVYAASVAWIFPLALFVDAGVGTLISRDLAYPNAPSSWAYVRAATAARFLLGLPILAVLYLFAPYLTGSPLADEGLAISAPLVIMIPMVSVFTAIFRARGQMRYPAMLNVGMLLAQVALTAVVFSAGWGVIGALRVNFVTTLGQLIVAALIWYWRFAEPDSGPAVNVRDLLRRAFPFAVAAVIAAVQMRLSIILLERVVSPEQAGTYTAAARFIEAGRLVPQAVFDAMLPFLTMMAAQPQVFKRTFGMSLRGLAAYGVVFGLLIWLLAYALIGLFFGQQFDASAEVLRVLAWSLLPMSLKYLRGLYWYALRRENWVNTVSLLALIGQIAASLVVLPAYGAIGAAWVMLVSETIAAAVLWLAKPPQISDPRVHAAPPTIYNE